MLGIPYGHPYLPRVISPAMTETMISPARILSKEPLITLRPVLALIPGVFVHTGLG
jgi:hypothetical protein